MFSLKSSRSTNNLAPSTSSSSNRLSPTSPRPTRTFPTGLQSPLQLSTPPLSDTSDSTLQSASSDGWSPTDERGYDEARGRGHHSAQQAASEGSSGGGGGLGGFFRRVRSSSRGRKKDEQAKVQHRAPPVPAVPSDFRLSLGLGAMGVGGAGIGIAGDDGTNGDLGMSMAVEQALKEPAKVTPRDGGDLGDLLYLVHAAGDRFTSEPSSTDWYIPSPSPPPIHTSPRQTTPTLLQPSAFSSPGSPSSPATPKPYYSFLSHLSNNNFGAYQSPPSSPPFLRTPPPKPESEDYYGGSSSEEEALWSRKPNTSFGGAPSGSSLPYSAPSKQTKALRPPILSPTRARRRALGPKAKDILDYTLLRLSPSPSTLSTAVPTRYQPSTLNHPLSTTPHRSISAFGPTSTIGVVLGRTLIARKLLRGLTMLESMDLERGAARPRTISLDSQSSASTAGSFDEAALRRTTPSLTSLIDTFEIDVEQPSRPSSTRPAVSPLALSAKPPSPQPSSPSLQPARLRSWIARPSFADSHLNTLAIEGGIEMVDLVRPARGRVPKLAVSERLKAMAGLSGAGAMEHGRKKEEGRPTRENPPGEGAKAEQLRGGLRASSFPPPSAVGKKPVLPGPLLLRALAETKRKSTHKSTADSSDDEDLPLAVLRSRGSSTPASPSSAAVAPPTTTAALQKAQARAEKLEAEVSKLRKKEESRKVSMQREKEQREVEWEAEKLEEEMKRRVAEQRRWSKVTGQVEEKSTGARSSSKDRQHKRASAPHPKQQASSIPSPSTHAAPFLPSAPSHPWAHPHMLAVPPPGWGIVPVPIMMPLPSPNTPPYYSPHPSPRFSTSAPSYNSSSPFSTFAQAGSARPPPPPLPHSHSAPNRISHRSTSQDPSSSSLKPTSASPTSTRRSSSHGPTLNHRSSRHAPPPLPSAMASSKRVSFKPSASVVGATSMGMERSRSSPESSVVERERAKARDQLVGGGGAAGRRKLVRRQ